MTSDRAPQAQTPRQPLRNAFIALGLLIGTIVLLFGVIPALFPAPPPARAATPQAEFTTKYEKFNAAFFECGKSDLGLAISQSDYDGYVVASQGEQYCASATRMLDGLTFEDPIAANGRAVLNRAIAACDQAFGSKSLAWHQLAAVFDGDRHPATVYEARRRKSVADAQFDRCASEMDGAVHAAGFKTLSDAERPSPPSAALPASATVAAAASSSDGPASSSERGVPQVLETDKPEPGRGSSTPPDDGVDSLDR